MQLSDLLEVLPPRVYLRRGELVIHFSTPADLVARITETQAAFSELERPSDAGRSESRGRSRANGRTLPSSTGQSETESRTMSDGKED
jgi:hypothetical protein